MTLLAFKRLQRTSCCFLEAPSWCPGHVSSQYLTRCWRSLSKTPLKKEVLSFLPIVLSQSLWMFSVWLVFTSNLNSQSTWLKVKFKENLLDLNTHSIQYATNTSRMLKNIKERILFLFEHMALFRTLPTPTNDLLRTRNSSFDGGGLPGACTGCKLLP